MKADGRAIGWGFVSALILAAQALEVGSVLETLLLTLRALVRLPCRTRSMISR